NPRLAAHRWSSAKPPEGCGGRPPAPLLPLIISLRVAEAKKSDEGNRLPCGADGRTLRNQASPPSCSRYFQSKWSGGQTRSRAPRFLDVHFGILPATNAAILPATNAANHFAA